MPTDLRIGKHLDRLWAVLGLSSAQNQRFTSFFDTAWTLFAQNTAKVEKTAKSNGKTIKNESGELCQCSAKVIAAV